MKRRLLALGYLLGACGSAAAQSVTVTKTNPMKVYAHYMPWFQTSYTLGGSGNWGWHWTMNNQNPNTILPNGQRQIASYYYPLIGPYDSSDPNVIEYHMLLMKLSGIDGVIVDWYGQKGTNGDINSLLSASNTIINKTSNYGLNVGVCLEDRFAGSTSDVTANINYAAQNYFGKSNYIRVGSSNSPLMPIFGPVKYQNAGSWSTVMSGVPAQSQPALLPLWYQSSQVSSYAKGEFSWIYQDAGTSDHQVQQQNFLTLRSPTLPMAMGAAYPGYQDFYAAGGDGAGSGFTIPPNNGQTLANLLALDKADASHMNMLQLATFNDYGEGTMFEPTVQTGFSYLQQVQQFTGVSYGLSDLQFVYQLYESRVLLSSVTAAQTLLNQTALNINQLQLPAAHTSLASALATASLSIGAINTLTLNGAAGLDVTNKHLVIDYTTGSDPASAVRSYLTTGRNGGPWNGNGITSSTAAASITSGSKVMALGYAEASALAPTNPLRQGADFTSIVVCYTFAGDANLDGIVNTLDFNALSTSYGTGTMAAPDGWIQGDFNYDGSVNSSDFDMLAANFGQAMSLSAALPSDQLPAATLIPEPLSLAVFGMTGLLALSRRHIIRAL